MAASNYILIDFENVQPKSVAHLCGHAFKLLVFVGANQTKIPIDLAQDLQGLGDGVRFVRIVGNGRNALDFHIAFTLGQLSQMDPKATFCVFSKDSGFDPLIEHMKAQGMQVSRVKEIAEIPLPKVERKKASKDKVEAIVENLRAQGQARPRKVKTLLNTINALYGKLLGEAELEDLVKRLRDAGHVSVDGDKVSYNL